LLGLPADDGKNALVAGRFLNGGEYPVECLSYDRCGGLPPDAPGGCLVNEAGRGHLPDIGLAADPLAQVGVCPHWVAGPVGELKGDGREHVVKRCESDRRIFCVVQDGEVLGVRVGVSDGHVERGTTQ
jgi:hypothetical protein